MRRSLLVALAVVVLVSVGRAATVAVPATQDTTLIEDPNGALANGAGPAVFAGRTNASDNGVRRGLFRFDLTAVLPCRSPLSIERVALVLTNVTESNVTPSEYRLHRVLASWGEGTSSSSGGGGDEATPGDSTWVHTFFPGGYWMHNGAQFDGEPSARLIISVPGVYRFESEALRRDLQQWAADPDRNFGWVLIGDETRRQTVRPFASREHPDTALRPVLEITYHGQP